MLFSGHNFSEIKDYLDAAAAYFNQPAFIAEDPVQIPHLFTRKEDREIAGFFAAIMAWGSRKTILAKARELITRMDSLPFDFVTDRDERKYKRLNGFVHRTLKAEDLIFLFEGLSRIYRQKGGMELLLSPLPGEEHSGPAINRFREALLTTPHEKRAEKHLANPAAGSAAKRLNMFLRWMVRKDACGVDMGIWKSDPALLLCPLDLHSGRTARRLGLLKRPTDDWQAVLELTHQLLAFDPADPVRYDFALFGLSRYPGLKW